MTTTTTTATTSSQLVQTMSTCCRRRCRPKLDPHKFIGKLLGLKFGLLLLLLLFPQTFADRKAHEFQFQFYCCNNNNNDDDTNTGGGNKLLQVVNHKPRLKRAAYGGQQVQVQVHRSMGKLVEEAPATQAHHHPASSKEQLH